MIEAIESSISELRSFLKRPGSGKSATELQQSDLELGKTGRDLLLLLGQRAWGDRIANKGRKGGRASHSSDGGSCAWSQLGRRWVADAREAINNQLTTPKKKQKKKLLLTLQTLTLTLKRQGTTPLAPTKPLPRSPTRCPPVNTPSGLPPALPRPEVVFRPSKDVHLSRPDLLVFPGQSLLPDRHVLLFDAPTTASGTRRQLVSIPLAFNLPRRPPAHNLPPLKFPVSLLLTVQLRRERLE